MKELTKDMLNLQNIYNKDRTIYLFYRINGELKIDKFTDFYPYYYIADNQGSHITFNNIKAKKVNVTYPKDLREIRGDNVFESDIPFTKKYIIECIPNFESTEFTYMFFDIEALAEELPEKFTAIYPITCITAYSSKQKEYKTFFIKDYSGDTFEIKEKKLIEDFINFIRNDAPDIILSWNVEFDYPYMCGRYKNFGKAISQINQSRWAKSGELPAGISICDYMLFFKKVKMREQSYALDKIAQKYLKEAPWKETNFSIVTDDIKEKNLNDVVRMVKLEEKFRILPYLNEIRNICKCDWEDIKFNSRVIDMLLLLEGKEQNIILPNKPIREIGENDSTDEAFQGAARGLLGSGVYHNLGKYDLGSAYPSMVDNFFLDSSNIVEGPAENAIEINGIWFKQEKALLPSLIRKLMNLKDNLKIEKEKCPSKLIDAKYDAIKAVVNSGFGVTGNPYFRYYDIRVASTITFLVRDLLDYVMKRLAKEKNIKVPYWDTDSNFVDTRENILELMNQYIQDWGKQYGKESINLKFDYEGFFESILILSTCHYYGMLHKKNGKIINEVKGIEMKRNSSTLYESGFQETLIKKVLNGDSKDSIHKWIESEQDRLKTLDISEIAFPCKLTKEYDGNPVFLTAYKNTQKIDKKFKIKRGELFYYIYINYTHKNTGEQLYVVAINDKFQIDRKFIDWNKMIERNIINKSNKILEALGWGKVELKTNQFKLF